MANVDTIWRAEGELDCESLCPQLIVPVKFITDFKNYKEYGCGICDLLTIYNKSKSVLLIANKLK